MRNAVRDVMDQTLYVLRFLCAHRPGERQIRMESTITRIEKLLISEKELRPLLESDPTVGELPFRRSSTEKLVVVWLHFREGFLTRQNLVRAAQVSIRKAHEQSLLDTYEEIAVGSFVGENIAGEGRVICVLVEKRAFGRVSSLPYGDFVGRQDPTHEGWHANAKPVDGVRVSWYRNPNDIPE